MNTQAIFEKFAALPEDKQKEVADFIAFLLSKVPESPSPDLSEPSQFFGMWADREEMKPSLDWVQMIRKTEWRSFNA